MDGKLKLIGKELRKELQKNSPTILSGGALIGLGFTIYFSIRAKPRIEKHIKEGVDEIEKIKSKASEEGTLDTKEVKQSINRVKLKTAGNVALDAAPAVISAGATVGCVCGIKEEYSRRISEATAVYEIQKDAHENYVEAAKEVVGEKKEEEIKEAAVKKRLEETYNSGGSTVIKTGKGDVLYYDEQTNTYLTASKSWLENCANKINKRLNTNEMYISVNEWCDELGVPRVKFGNDIGWCGGDGDQLELYYTVGELPNGEHCITISYKTSKRFRDTNSMPW